MITWLKNLLRISRWDKSTENPRRYDCRKAGWGHECHLDDERKFLIERGIDVGAYWPCSGHLTPRVSVGDEVIVSFGKGPAVLRFVEVRNCGDPADMFFGLVKSVDYLENLGPKPTTDELAESALIAIEGRTPESHPEQFRRGNGV